MTPVLRLLPLVLAVAGCNDMSQQPRYRGDAPTPLFGDGTAAQAPPDGTVARDDRPAARPAMSRALLARGRERFDIYCTPCHDYAGTGDGTVVRRGFPKPPSLHEPRLVAAPAEHVVDTITHGHGVMFSYADRVAPADRWAIAAYVRALQVSQDAPAAALTPADRAALEAKP